MDSFRLVLGVILIAVAVIGLLLKKRRIAQYKKIKDANLGKVHIWFHPAWTYVSSLFLVIVGIIFLIEGLGS